MERQLPLVEVSTSHTLDRRTIEAGRRGLAMARAVLRQSREVAEAAARDRQAA
jgi:hypothetical protein